MSFCSNFGKTIEDVREDWKGENGAMKTWLISRVCKPYMPWCSGNGGCPHLQEGA